MFYDDDDDDEKKNYDYSLQLSEWDRRREKKRGCGHGRVE